MKLLYNGSLSPQTVEGVTSLMRHCPHVVEVTDIDSSFWETFEEFKDTLPKYPLEIESGSTGEAYTTERVLCGIVPKNNSLDHRFFFFKTNNEKNDFVHWMKRYDVNDDPFQTVMEM